MADTELGLFEKTLRDAIRDDLLSGAEGELSATELESMVDERVKTCAGLLYADSLKFPRFF